MCNYLIATKQNRNTRIKLVKYYKTATYYKENIYSINGNWEDYNKPIFNIYYLSWMPEYFMLLFS